MSSTTRAFSAKKVKSDFLSADSESSDNESQTHTNRHKGRAASGDCSFATVSENSLTSTIGQQASRTLATLRGKLIVKGEHSSNNSVVSSKKSTRVTGTWTKVNDDLLVYLPANWPFFALPPNNKNIPVAGFDMDDTIIASVSGKYNPTNVTDWKFLFEKQVPQKLEALAKEGFLLAIFSNQRGVGNGSLPEHKLKERVELVLARLAEVAHVQLAAFFATRGGTYRKPCVGMWEHLESLLRASSLQATIDKSKSVYVGDAAGRIANWAPGRKKDFAISDRLLALNLGIKFATPEEFFLGQAAAVQFNMPSFDPRKLANTKVEPSPVSRVDGKQELILMVGYPASGKSEFVKRHLLPKGYVHVNQDTLKTPDKCIRATSEALEAGKSVVVDNTNVDTASRKRYIDVAKRSLAPVRAFLMDVTLEHAMHNELFREIFDSKHSKINKMIFFSFRKKFEEPKLEEGIEQVVQVRFVPEFTGGEEASPTRMRQLYFMFLADS